MDWMEQSLEMMKAWSEMQKKMWDGWMDAAAGFGTTEKKPLEDWVARWQEAMSQSMDVWEDLVRTVADAQSKWASSEAAAAFWPGREEDVKKMMKVWVDQTAAMLKTWTEAQRTLWDNWFGVATTVAKSTQGPTSDWFERWQTMTRRSMEAWEELSKKTMETQADWMKAWATPTGQAGKTTGAAGQE